MAEKTLQSFQQLSAVAQSLNEATDELTRVVSALDEALQRLNVGLYVWVPVVTWGSENDESYEREEVGYAKMGSAWGITIRRLIGRHDSDEPDEVRGVWAFNDAPRDLRLRAVEYLPEAIDALAKAAAETTAAVTRKIADAKAFAAATGILNPDGSAKPVSIMKGKKA